MMYRRLAACRNWMQGKCRDENWWNLKDIHKRLLNIYVYYEHFCENNFRRRCYWAQHLLGGNKSTHWSLLVWPITINCDRVRLLTRSWDKCYATYDGWEVQHERMYVILKLYWCWINSLQESISSCYKEWIVYFEDCYLAQQPISF